MQLALGVAGAAIGGTIGGPTGARIGWAIGSAIGGALTKPDAQVNRSPGIDLKVVGTDYGQPILHLFGSMMTGGQMWWNTDRQPTTTVTTSGGGKGGGGQPETQTETTTYTIDCLIGLTNHEIIGIAAIFENGGLIWTSDSGATAGAIAESGEVRNWDRMTVYTGASDQLPDSDYEAAVGVGNAPAYRGRGTVFIKGLQLGTSGALRNLTFVVVANGSAGPLVNEYAQPSGFGDVLSFPEWCPSIYNPVNQEVWTVDGRYGWHSTSPARITIFDLTTETFSASVDFPNFVGNPTRSYWLFSPASSGISFRYFPEWGLVLVATFQGTPSLSNWSWYDAATREYVTNMVDASPTWIATASVQKLLAIDPVRNVCLFYFANGELYFWSLNQNHCPGGIITHHSLPGSGTFDFGTVTNDGTIFAKVFGGSLGDGWCYFEPSGYALNFFAFDADGCASFTDDFCTTYDTSRNAMYYWSAGSSPYLMKLDCATLAISRLSTSGFSSASDIGNSSLWYAEDIDKVVALSATAVKDPVVTFFDPSDGSYTQIAATAGDGFMARQFAYAPGVLWSSGDYSMGGGSPDLDELRFNVLTKTCPTVQDVVSELCLRSGLTANQFDVTALSSITRTVCCLPISQIEPTRQSLELLMSSYFFEMTISDKLYFIPRGGSSVATIPYEDLGASLDETPSEPLPLREVNELEIPSQIALSYININNDYQPDTQYSDRLISASALTVKPVSYQIGMTPAEAKGVADTTLLDQSASRLTAVVNVLGDYCAIVPTDPVTLTGSEGSLYRMRIVEKMDAYPLLEWKCVLDDTSVLESQQITSTDYESQTTIAATVATLMRFADIPMLRDADDSAGFYIGAKGAGTPYPGGGIFDSDDNISYERRATITASAVFGYCTTALDDWSGGRVFDEMSSVTVSVGNGTLSSSTRAAVLGSLAENAMMIGSEVVQFVTATLVSTGVYTLTSLLRGGRGTEWAMVDHVVGEPCLLLNATSLRRVDLTNSQLGASRYYKGVTLGRPLSSASAQIFTTNGICLKPFAPVDGRVSRDTSNNATLTWRYRSRLSVRMVGTLGISVPQSESPESYEIDFFTDNTYATQAGSTKTASSESYSYSAADQTTDGLTPGNTLYYQIYSMSSIVGRGYVLESEG